MNEFTKEELLTMMEIMDELYFGKFYSKREYPELYDKIQSMIDDYCEHEPYTYIDGVAAVPFCQKCRRLI